MFCLDPRKWKHLKIIYTSIIFLLNTFFPSFIKLYMRIVLYIFFLPSKCFWDNVRVKAALRGEKRRGGIVWRQSNTFITARLDTVQSALVRLCRTISLAFSCTEALTTLTSFYSHASLSSWHFKQICSDMFKVEVLHSKPPACEAINFHGHFSEIFKNP